jgi:hypothetical protein
VTPQNIALVVWHSNAKRKMTAVDVKLVSLADGKVMYSGPPAADHPTAAVSNLVLDDYGLMAWISTPYPTGAASVSSVHVVDANGLHNVGSVASMWVSFFKFDFVKQPNGVNFDRRLVWPEEVMFG